MKLFNMQVAKTEIENELFNHHPSIDSSGTVKGMIKLGYWKQDDVVIKYKNFYINLSIWISEEN